MNWKVAVKNAKHHLAIGNKEIYITGTTLDDYPWNLATSCEPGGSHRLDMDTSIWFRAKHKSGLTFRWTFDVEPYSANGKGYYEIDTAGLRRIMEMLPTVTVRELASYLSECANKVEKQGKEWQQIADKQMKDAKALRDLIQV